MLWRSKARFLYLDKCVSEGNSLRQQFTHDWLKSSLLIQGYEKPKRAHKSLDTKCNIAISWSFHDAKKRSWMICIHKQIEDLKERWLLMKLLSCSVGKVVAMVIMYIINGSGIYWMCWYFLKNAYYIKRTAVIGGHGERWRLS